MSILRAAVRLVLFVSTTVALCATYLVTRRRRTLFRIWAQLTERIIGMRVTAAGLAPRGPFLLVANHLSYVDIVLLGARVDAWFIAKSEVARWPILGRMARSAGTIFIERDSLRDLARVSDEIRRAFLSGSGVVIFPEGTSSDGREVLPFKPALLDLAARKSLPVWPAAISYTTPKGSPPAETAVCWWGDMTFLPHFWNLLRLPYFEARVEFLRPAVATSRAALSRRLWLTIDASRNPPPAARAI